jgi:hypothetical protein
MAISSSSKIAPVATLPVYNAVMYSRLRRNMPWDIVLPRWARSIPVQARAPQTLAALDTDTTRFSVRTNRPATPEEQLHLVKSSAG